MLTYRCGLEAPLPHRERRGAWTGLGVTGWFVGDHPGGRAAPPSGDPDDIAESGNREAGRYAERMVYAHTQKSRLWLFVAAPVLVVVAVTAISADANPTVIILWSLGAAAFIAFVAHFSSLTVTVEPARARASFGRGWPRKTVDLAAVTAVRPVRNRWFYGFGIRWIPKGTLWNVWGFDAVEFALDGGRVVRFGTDDRDGLLAALAGLIRTV